MVLARRGAVGLAGGTLPLWHGEAPAAGSGGAERAAPRDAGGRPLLQRAAELAPPPGTRGPWTLGGLRGAAVEISDDLASAAGLSAAFALILDAQRRGEPAVWLAPPASSFFPPDVAAGGVDLAALAVVRLPRAVALARAAEQLLRSGGFGLAVLDLGAGARLGRAPLARLGALARQHDATVLFLTQKDAAAPALGSLPRWAAQRQRREPGRFACRLESLGDRRPPGGAGPWQEVLDAPDGLR